MTERYGNNLRFLKRRNVENTVDVYKNLMSDYINANGIDVTYFRKNYSFYAPTSGAVKADWIYGEEPNAQYTVSAEMVVFMEVLADAYMLNRFGLQTDSEVQVFLAIRDFEEQFRPIIGDIQTTSYEVPMCGYVSAGMVSARLVTDDLYGVLSGVVQNDLSLTTELVIQERPKNLIYHASLAYEYPLDTVTGSLSGTMSENNGIYSGIVTGALVHRINAAPNQKAGYTLRPQPGDFFRLENPVLHDEYEVTRIIDRQYAGGGGSYNPLLDKYAYCVSCTRRNPSDEIANIDGVVSKPEEPFTTNKIEESEIISDKNKEIFGYLNGEDEAYGGFGR